MCFKCGQLYCGDCNTPDMMGRVESCPTCRAPFGVSDEANVQRLQEMLKRSPGRHTALALVSMGNMYEFGTGVIKNHKTAFDWYKRAADGGDPGGEQCMGTMFEFGKGVSQSFAEAASWYLRAAIQGDHKAQKNLGFLYVTFRLNLHHF